MSSAYLQHLSKVKSCFAENDFDLGYRRLIDCAFETQDLHLFKDTIQFCHDFDSLKSNREAVAGRVSELLEKMSRCGVKAAEQNSNLLQVENLSKAYKKGRFALNNVNFDLHCGEIIGLVGENGNGKTTLLRLIAKELEPDTGSVVYSLGKNIKDDYQLRSAMAYVEQRIPRWFGTLTDNLQFTLANYGIKGEENFLRSELMMARLGLLPFKNLTWTRISSGYKTRFELAKTLLRKPRILLLDEPLANLDIMSQQTLLQDLRFMSQSLTAPFGMMLSSQHIYEVEKVSGKIIFLKSGKPQYNSGEDRQNKLMIELELAKGDREDLAALLANEKPEKMVFNGGVYLLTFDGEVRLQEVLTALSSDRVEILSFRNISHSSRRFFIE